MPARTVSTPRDRAEIRSRLLAAQFWVGIALAPVAALLLIFGGTAAAAVIAIIAVVVLALSVLRSDAAPWSRGNGATTDEMNALRDDVRADITTAARATHRALSEKMALLEESVAGVQRLAESSAGIRRLEDAIAGVQRQVEAARAAAIEARAAVDNQRELPPPSPRRPAAVVGSVPGVVRHTETVVTRSMYVDRPADGFESARASGSTVYGTAARSAAGYAAVDEAVNGSTTYGSASRRRDVSDRDRDEADRDSGRYDSGRHDSGRHDSGRHDSGRHDSGRHDSGRRDSGPHTGGRPDAGRDDAGHHEVGRGSARWIEVDAPAPRERESQQDARRDDSRGASRGRYEPRADDQSRGEPPRELSRRELPSDHDDAHDRDRGVDRVDEYHHDRHDADNRDHGSDRDDSHESWTEQRLRAYLPQMRESLGYRSGGLGEQSDSSGDLANDARWSQMRDGDRWAEVRSDDRGRELRMAERHAERHVDETGTQLRIVDRWSSVREERVPAADDWDPAPETRAQRRRRADRDDRDGLVPATVTRAELPRPRHTPDEFPAERSSGEVGRGWRDVRSGVIEPDHSDRYEDSRYHVPAQVAPARHTPSRDTPSGGWRSSDPPSYDPPSYDPPAYGPPSYGPASYGSASHDDVGIYRRRSEERAGARRDSGDFPPARGRDSGDFPPAWSAEPVEERDDRDDRWVREPSRRSSGRSPRLDFEVTDDRWH